ncbi:MAG: hypothetical protein ACM3XM_20685 [Mycobacterium leprae]
MAERKRRPKIDWQIEVQPEGTPAEAEVVAERVLATVAGWVRRETSHPGTDSDTAPAGAP